MPPAAILKRSRGIILSQWVELLRLRREVLKNPELEAIHDLRVTSRRFRAVVGLFEPWIPPKSAALLKKICRKLTRGLGGLRNIDEALIFFRRHTPAKSGGGYQICRHLEKLRPGELTRIKKALTALDYHRINRIVRKAAAGLSEERIMASKNSSMPAYFSETCIRLSQPVQELLPAATSCENPDARHALRIAIKKLRYFFEIAATVFEYDCNTVLGRLKEYQTLLGHMNDVAEFAILCSTLPLSRHERGFIQTTLQGEEKLQLRNLAELIEQKPLGSTFLTP